MAVMTDVKQYPLSPIRDLQTKIQSLNTDCTVMTDRTSGKQHKGKCNLIIGTVQGSTSQGGNQPFQYCGNPSPSPRPGTGKVILQHRTLYQYI